MDENGTELTGNPRITVPVGGVTVSDTAITINTQTIQFGNGTYADSNLSSKWRRFKLISARDDALTPQNLRFQVGIPPTFTSYYTTSGTSNYRRDSDAMEINGTGFGLVSSIEIVDVQGQTIIPNSFTSPNAGGVTIVSTSQMTIAPNSFLYASSMDSSAPYSRRIKITTPFGIKVTDNNSTGSFSMSATPLFHSSVATTYAGGGYNGGNNIYNINDGDLVINGRNFLGVKTISFEDNASNTYFTVDFNPLATPGGLAVDTNGSQISITKAFINDRNASWANSGGLTTRRVKLTSAADQDATTDLIITSDSTD